MKSEDDDAQFQALELSRLDSSKLTRASQKDGKGTNGTIAKESLHCNSPGIVVHFLFIASLSGTL